GHAGVCCQKADNRSSTSVAAAHTGPVCFAERVERALQGEENQAMTRSHRALRSAAANVGLPSTLCSPTRNWLTLGRVFSPEPPGAGWASGVAIPKKRAKVVIVHCA